MDKKSAKNIDSNLRNVTKHDMFQNATCAQSVYLLQNSEMILITTCAQSLSSFLNSEMY